MPGEDQERFEDYLDLERFIAELQAGNAAHPPQELTPAQARIYQMALQFHVASSGVGEPRPEFAGPLYARLEEELQEQQDVQALPQVQPAARPKKRLSRRSLLAGSAATAASMAVGMGLDRMVAQNDVPNPTVIKWFPVAHVDEVSHQAIKFTTANLIGYVLRCDGDENASDKGQIIAVSAACTHRGCIVNWSASDRKFHCPCHGGVFTEEGTPDSNSQLQYLTALPRLDVLLKDGQVYVKMPLVDKT